MIARASAATRAARPPRKSTRRAAGKTAGKTPGRSADKAAGKKPSAPASAVPAAGEPPKVKKKLVRDSFTMPQADFDLIGVLKERALGFKRPAKKSELLRAGLQALAALDDGALRTALNRLPPLKPGRPRKSG